MIETKWAAVAADEGYSRYQEMGGIINKKDYLAALARVEEMRLTPCLIAQVGLIASVSGIELDADGLDQRILLYGILRTDSNPEATHHHSQMSDQRLFAEVLRMLGDIEALEKLISRHPHINFS